MYPGYASAGVVVLAFGLLGTQARAQWAGFVDGSSPRCARTASASPAPNPEAGDSNENYYDGDFADFDGDGRLDCGSDLPLRAALELRAAG